MRRKYPFALVEVLVAMMLISITATSILPFFHHMYHTYQKMEEKLLSEMVLQEQIAKTYAEYLIAPPTFAEITEGFHKTSQEGRYQISQKIHVHLSEGDDASKNVCTAIVELSVFPKEPEGKEPLAQGEMEICFIKSI